MYVVEWKPDHTRLSSSQKGAADCEGLISRGQHHFPIPSTSVPDCKKLKHPFTMINGAIATLLQNSTPTDGKRRE